MYWTGVSVRMDERQPVWVRSAISFPDSLEHAFTWHHQVRLFSVCVTRSRCHEWVRQWEESDCEWDSQSESQRSMRMASGMWGSAVSVSKRCGKRETWGDSDWLAAVTAGPPACERREHRELYYFLPLVFFHITICHCWPALWSRKSSRMLTDDMFQTHRMTVKASCPMRLERFPMDIQRCPLEVGSCESLIVVPLLLPVVTDTPQHPIPFHFLFLPFLL
jgi:hypothetical protein